MKPNLSVISAIVKKDFLGLLPLVLVSFVVFLVVPVVANLDLLDIAGDQEFWAFLQANIQWAGFFIGLFLIISALQLDPADSLNHDWLTRPIARIDWLLAKCALVCLVYVFPVFLSRVIADISAGMEPGVAIYYAAGIESFEATIFGAIILMAALLAPNLRKLIMLLVGVFFVFLMPGWSVTSPLLAAIGIRLGGDYDSLMWVQGLVIILASLSGFALIYWFLYCKRQRRAAYIAYWTMVFVAFLSVYPPRSVYNWETAIALNAALINDTSDELEDQVILQPAIACFPSAIVDANSHTQLQSSVLAQARWSEMALAQAGEGALSVSTPIRYRELLTEWIKTDAEARERSIKWRLNRIRGRAHISADSLPQDVELLYSGTAENRFAPIAASKTDHWLVPGETVQSLHHDDTASFTLTYDLALLQPTPYELPMDGVRRRLPKLGYCKAEMDSGANEVRVECLKRGEQPDLVSAEFIGMENSRVDTGSRATLTSNALETLKRARYELTLTPASLTNDSSVIVTAYETARLLNKQLTLPGVLGGDPGVCPLLGNDDIGIERPTSWSDKSPHEISFIAVEPGVRLEVLDWRQEIKADAQTLLLLPGLGATAHSYDDLAIKLAESYNVVGITRRGTGDSAKPERGYQIERLSRDILQVMDALELPSAILVGHSFGGEELSYIGANFPARVEGLIYLDAAYDRVAVNSGEELRRFRELSMQLPEAPPVRPSEAVSYEALGQYARRTGRNANVPEGEIIASYDLSTGNIKHDMLYLDALMRGIESPDYSAIDVPALALYAVPGSAESLMEAWYDKGNPALQPLLEELFTETVTRSTVQVQKFATGMSNGRVIVIEDADHWIFLSNEQEVLAAMNEFIAGLE